VIPIHPSAVSTDEHLPDETNLLTPTGEQKVSWLKTKTQDVGTADERQFADGYRRVLQCNGDRDNNLRVVEHLEYDFLRRNSMLSPGMDQSPTSTGPAFLIIVYYKNVYGELQNTVVWCWLRFCRRRETRSIALTDLEHVVERSSTASSMQARFAATTPSIPPT